MNFELAQPRALWLLPLVVPLLILFLWWSWRKRQQLAAQFISPRLLESLKVGFSPTRQKARLALLVTAVTFLLLSLTRPQWGYSWEEARQRGLDIIVAIDTSNSMLAEDMPPNRLARAKLAALDLMRRAKSDRLGLIAFAGDAFLTCPLTLDDSAFGQSVEALDTRSISQGGTAIAEAINTARAAFKDEAENHKVLILFTDGEDHDGEAVQAAERAAKEGMRIYTIGLGTPDGELLRIRDERGRIDYIRDDNGQPVKSRLNEALLKDIATTTGAFYLPLRGSKTIDTLYDHPQGLGSLPKTTSNAKLLRRYHERYHWFIIIGIGLLLAEMFLPERPSRRRARSNATATSPVGVAETVAVLLLVALPLGAIAGPGRALRDYEQGKYDEAFKEYHQLLDDKKNDPRLNFNAGTAAYQSGQFDEAAKQFNESLNSPDLQLQQRSYYNLGNTYFRLGQKPPASKAGAGAASGAPDLDAMQKAWEQAVQHYDSALKLNPKDEDAKFNRSFVHQQLEELKKLKQQQQSKDNSKNQDKNQQNQQQQSKNDQNKDQKDQQSQQQQNQDSARQDQKQNQGKDQKQDQQGGKDQQEQQKEQQDQQAKGQSGKPDQKQDQQQAKNRSGQPKDESKDKEEAEREAAMMAAGQMTPRQAQQLLDAQKGDEEVLPVAQPDKPQQPRSRSFKNW